MDERFMFYGPKRILLIIIKLTNIKHVTDTNISISFPATENVYINTPNEGKNEAMILITSYMDIISVKMANN